MLKKGDKAPDFAGKNQDGKEIKLSDFKGSKLVLYFYPKDNTPGCTAEACDLRDNYQKFESMGYKILGVSKDSEKSHKGFIEKFNLPFPLISDTEATILKAYDAWGRNGLLMDLSAFLAEDPNISMDNYLPILTDTSGNDG